tara:strand:- start:1859 stop:2677 length:819 start_codon:yes stop_codon:yes gene_type:complete
MPTLVGMRRRGYPPAALREFCERIGVAKSNSVVQIAQLEDSVRQELNQTANRVMGVLRPLRVVIENYPEGKSETLEAINNPQETAAGTRDLPFSRVLYIEQDDFREAPPKKFFRLGPGREVRLRYAYFIKCTDVIKDSKTGKITELRCTYDPQTKGGQAPDGRKVRGTIHWVSAEDAIESEVRMYEHLFTKENPEDTSEGQDYMDFLNTESMSVLTGCKVEPSLAHASHGARYQLERQGYFCVDADSADDKLVLNQTVSLRDTWAKLAKSKS